MREAVNKEVGANIKYLNTQNNLKTLEQQGVERGSNKKGCKGHIKMNK